MVVNNLHFVMWDVGGQESLRQSWATYYTGAKCLILVIDSTDVERMPIVREELHKMLAHEDLKGAVLLLYANKQDMEGALSAAEITEKLNLTKLGAGRSWHIQACCALSGEGLYPGMDWVATQIKGK